MITQPTQKLTDSDEALGRPAVNGEMAGEDGNDGAAAPRAGGGGGSSYAPFAGSADGCAYRLGGTRARGGEEKKSVSQSKTLAFHSTIPIFKIPKIQILCRHGAVDHASLQAEREDRQIHRRVADASPDDEPSFDD